MEIFESYNRYAEIIIPPELLLTNFMDPIENIVTSIYPNLFQNFTNTTFLQSRTILASTIEIVDEINDYITIFFQVTIICLLFSFLLSYFFLCKC